MVGREAPMATTKKTGKTAKTEKTANKFNTSTLTESDLARVAALSGGDS